MRSESIVVYEFIVDEYLAEVTQLDEGFAWRLFGSTLTHQRPGPTLQSLKVHPSISAAVRAARKAYGALPLVLA